jgi:hypothetical protein
MKPTRQVRLRVAELAEERGLDERELASQARMSVIVTRRMFANERVAELHLGQLAKVAEVFGVATGSLFADE